MGSRSRRIARVAFTRFARAVVHARFGMAKPAVRRSAFAVQARCACEELGPTFIKLGQLASVRPDVFSAEMVFELERLQDSVAPVPVEAIRAVIRREFGCEPEEVFESFDSRPLASASIAQVHRATLAQEYRPVCGGLLPVSAAVVVKVVRPGIEKMIADDCAIARRLVKRLKRFSIVRRFNLELLLEEFEASLHSELDLRNEGRVADRFAFDFRDDPIVLVPPVVWMHSTRQVLTMEFVEGWRLSDLDEATRAGIDGHALAAHGAEVFMRQVLVHGRFHADLHPANLFVTPDSRICYLDFGIVGRTEPGQRIAITQILAATVYGDADRALRYSRELGLEIPESDEDEIRERVDALMRKTMRQHPSDVRGFAIGFLSLLADYRVTIPVGYGLLIKALVTVEGVARCLYPDIDIMDATKSFTTRLIAREMMRPANLYRRIPELLKAMIIELAE